MQAKYHGPYRVLEVRGSVVTLQKDNHQVKVNMDRLRPCFKLRELDPAEANSEEEGEPSIMRQQETQEAVPRLLYNPQPITDLATHTTLPTGGISSQLDG